jgi:thiol-disulfide isomerase/thioredoxin
MSVKTVRFMSKAEKRESKTERKSTFHEDIKNTDKAFVLFYATWCPFSQRFLSIFEEYSKSNPKECLRVIVDEEPDVCEEYAIEYYPTVIMFKKGRIHRRLDAEPGVGLNKKQFKDLTEEQ